MNQQQELNAILARPENKTCADCGRKNPDWASVPFGICVCLQCSGIHRSLGTHITFVQSLKLDKWTDENLAKMKVGGNDRFIKFLKQRGLTNQNIAQKYSNPQVKQYAKIIEDDAKKLLQQKPTNSKQKEIESDDEEIFFESKINKDKPKLHKSSSSSFAPIKPVPKIITSAPKPEKPTFEQKPEKQQNEKRQVLVVSTSDNSLSQTKPPKQSTSTPNLVRKGLRKTNSSGRKQKPQIIQISSADFDKELDDFEDLEETMEKQPK